MKTIKYWSNRNKTILIFIGIISGTMLSSFGLVMFTAPLSLSLSLLVNLVGAIVLGIGLSIILGIGLLIILDLVYILNKISERW